MSIGQLVRFNRLEKNYSLRDLGALSNVSHTLISNIEKGKVSANKDTIKELLNLLEISFRYDDDLINEFTFLYDEAFNYMFEYEYTKSNKIMDTVIMDREKYVSSIVAADFFILYFLHLALNNQLYGDKSELIERIYRIKDYFSVRQSQLFNLTYGIYQFHKGNYRRAEEYLLLARNIGDNRIDMLINTYLIKVYVKMYLFMEVSILAEKTIQVMESELLYLRAMEVRLSVAQSYILVLRYDDALELIDKVYRFASLYPAIYLLSECDLLYTAIYIKKKQYDLAKIKVNKVILNQPFAYFARLYLAVKDKNEELISKTYNEFFEVNSIKESRRDQLILSLTAHNYKIIKLPEKVYLKQIKELIEIGMKNIDLELLDNSYDMLIREYLSRRMYKKAFEASEVARKIRKYGCD